MVTPAGRLGDDHALVVGISRYPTPGFAADLQGPDNDATLVRDWLVDEEGGRLPPENVVLLRTMDFAPISAEDPQPASARVQRVFRDLADRTRDAPGRRLYLYFSGHGFAPDLEEAALFTAEATQDSPAHVYVHDYLRWFRKAQRFEQSVLWVDACMNFMRSVPVQPVPLRVQLGTAVPGPAFIALAAQTRRALELPMPDGRVHGVFTWTLLQGLRGSAANRRGRVTGESLQSFLHNAMADVIPAAARTTAAVDLQPFVRADEGMEFVRLPSRRVHPVTLRFRGVLAGQELRIWSGAPHSVVVAAQLSGPEWRGSLVRGLYVAEVAEAGLRQGFQVTGAGPVEATVEQTGPLVIRSDGSELFRLDVVTPNPATSVVVIDHDFRRVLTDTGGLQEREAPGVYKVRTQFGRDLTTSSEQVVLLDRDLALGGDELVPVLPSPAPLRGTAADARHTELFTAAATRAGPPAGDGMSSSTLSVMVRYCAGADATADLPHPMTGLRLVDAAGDTVAELLRDSRVEEEDEDPVAVWERATEPGVHFLRQELPRGTYEAAFTVSPGWRTQVVLRRTAGLGAAWSSDRPNPAEVLEPDDLALFLRRTSEPPAAGVDDVLEAARLALVQGRDVFAAGQGTELRRVLLEEHPDPVATVIGCHLSLRAMAGSNREDAALGPGFDRAVQRLRDLVGTGHPDVEALSLRCMDPGMRASAPFATPPAFTASWQLVVDASYDRPELIPAELWARVHASRRLGPFFVWAVDEAAHRSHLEQLAAWVRGYDGDDGSAAAIERPAPAVRVTGGRFPLPGRVRGFAPARLSVPPALRDAARHLGIPATVTDGLWEAHERPA